MGRKLTKEVIYSVSVVAGIFWLGMAIGSIKNVRKKASDYQKFFVCIPPNFDLNFQMAITDFENSIDFDLPQSKQVGHLKNELFEEKSKFLTKKDFLKFFLLRLVKSHRALRFCKKIFVECL